MHADDETVQRWIALCKDGLIEKPVSIILQDSPDFFN